MTYREDQCRLRKGHSDENFSRLRRMSMNLLRRDAGRKDSLRGKMKMCGWDHHDLLQVLGLDAKPKPNQPQTGQ